MTISKAGNDWLPLTPRKRLFSVSKTVSLCIIGYLWRFKSGLQIGRLGNKNAPIEIKRSHKIWNKIKYSALASYFQYHKTAPKPLACIPANKVDELCTLISIISCCPWLKKKKRKTKEKN